MPPSVTMKGGTRNRATSPPCTAPNAAPAASASATAAGSGHPSFTSASVESPPKRPDIAPTERSI